MFIPGQKRKLEEEFEKIDKIGQGSYGVVYKVRRKATKDIVALKRVKLNINRQAVGFDEGIPSSSLREIAALKNLRHPNILNLHEIIHTGSSLYLVFEYLDLDLKKTLDATQWGLPEKVAKSYLYQLFGAIAFCHTRRILHRDLKLQNLLVTKNGIIKLADFGLARTISLPMRVYTKEVVTLWYRAPEILLGSTYYGPPIDIWSLGCIFYEMLTKRALFPGDSEIDQLFKIFQILGTPSEYEWSQINEMPYYKTIWPNWKGKSLTKLLGNYNEAAELLQLMLTYDPNRRISAKQALKHSYFEELNTHRLTLKDIQDPTNRQQTNN